MRLFRRKNRVPMVAAKSGWLRTLSLEGGHRRAARAAAASPARSDAAPITQTREQFGRITHRRINLLGQETAVEASRTIKVHQLIPSCPPGHRTTPP